MKLTDSIVAGLELPPGKTEHFIWDSTLPGFGCRLRGDTKRWCVQYRAGRQQRRESLGDVRKIKAEAARKIARQRFARVELGHDPAAERRAKEAETFADKLTLGVVAERYLKTKADVLRPSTYNAAARYLRRHFSSLHRLPIAAIKRAEVAAVLQELTAKHGRIAAARARSNLQSLFTWAMGEGLVESNPVIATNNPDTGQSRDRTLTDSELAIVWNACLNGDDQYGQIIRLLILSGCRKSEIGNLRWDEVDLDSGVITISGERIKNRRTLSLTLPPMAVEILRSIPRREGKQHIFGKTGDNGFNRWSYEQLRLNNRIAAAIGRPMARWTPHDLRRTMRSGLGRIGIQPHVAELCIGHAKGGIVAVYDRHGYQAEIKTALLRWSEHVASVVEDRQTNVVSWRA